MMGREKGDEHHQELAFRLFFIIHTFTFLSLKSAKLFSLKKKNRFDETIFEIRTNDKAKTKK